MDEPAAIPTALSNVTNAEPRLPLPTISVTKPPVPLPVDLPTPHDIVTLPSPPDSIHSSFEDDLEAGHGAGMREVSREQETVLVSSRRSTNPSVPTTADASGSALATSIPLPISPVSSPLVEPVSGILVEPVSPPPISPQPDLTDLLADSTSTLETTPIEPVASPVQSKLPEIIAIDSEEVPLDPVKSEPTSEPLLDGVDDEAPYPDPNVTIRLVGGGGTAGIVDETSPPPDDDVHVAAEHEPEPEPQAEPDIAEIASVKSATSAISTNSAKKDQAKHEKKKSSGFSSLKKFGQLGGKRKKDSSSSVRARLSSVTG